MFRKHTVFVIGAGASVPYNFPTGAQLQANARSLSADSISQKIDNTLNMQGPRELSAAVRASRDQSIDSLLEHRRDLWPAGKRLIAAMILDHEAIALMTPDDPDDDWLSWVYQQMAEGARSIEEFAANPVNFVTFNYDRLIEKALLDALPARYNVQQPECWRAIRRIPIIHLHGSVGPLLSDDGRRTDECISFGGRGTPDVNERGIAMNRAEERIQIVHDAAAESEAFQQARRLLAGAEQVIFLGFGFGRDNIRRLETERIRQESWIYCATYGMTSTEVRRNVFGPLNRNSSQQLIDTGHQRLRLFLRERADIVD